MHSKEYVEMAKRTDLQSYDAPCQRLSDPKTARLLHASIGLATEAGELQDALKKHIFYGKEIDWVNLNEEAGDLFWYLAILADELNISFSRLMTKNIAKLMTRYPDKFSETNALSRNLEKERQTLSDED